MSSNQDTISDINTKTKSGFLWILVINILAAPVQFLISLTLGRISPELLGKYGFLEILLNLVITIGMFGGPNLMIKYIPSLKVKEIPFFISKYIKQSLLLLLGVFSIIWFLDVFKLIDLGGLLGDNTPPVSMYKWIVLWSVLYLTYYILNSSQSAILQLKDFAIASKLYFFLLFFFLIIFYYLGVKSWHLIFYSSTVAIVFCIIFILSKNFKSFLIFNTKEYSFPSGFWRYSITMYLSTFLTFLYEKLDQIIILMVFDLKFLGIYFGIMKVAFISKLIPQIINRGLISSLSNLIHLNAIDEIRVYYRKIISANYLICTLISIVLIVFSNFILELFGSVFADYKLILLLFIITAFIDFYETLNTNILILKGEDKKVFINTVFKNISFLVSAYFLLPIFNLEGLVLSRIISLIIGVIYTRYNLNKVSYHFNYSIKTLVLIVLIILLYMISSYSVTYKIIFSLTSIIIVTLMNKKDIVNILKNIPIWK
ncbi:lipopolysaccharide biosynthesis protein [Mesoflavibacter zeaxanthinifaciens]|uniref:Polysaccharide biosynthesis protein C-terminal domain-containing protein n=2 Tax=Mesoflavibacter TaxID=444051 RepID=A0A2T1N6G5_9FLAO|nr:hypothetical protein [Mesoflavibacter zeaxanthinifaciens]PSG87186.1 hypothetical protein C7H61_13850 [Mesoflavibacter zeaxanthinifaciens subsp. sabulilitoris]